MEAQRGYAVLGHPAGTQIQGVWPQSHSQLGCSRLVFMIKASSKSQPVT